MLKKMMLLAISVCALVAVAGPAVAQAQMLYTLGKKGQHQPLNLNTPVKATSTDLKIYSPGWYGELECTKVIIAGEVFANGTPESRIGNTVAEWPEFGVCNSGTQLWVGEITINEKEVGLMTDVEFIISGQCFLEGNPPFTYEHDTNTLTVTGTKQLLVVPGSNCGYATSATLTASFKLTTATGVPVYIE